MSYPAILDGARVEVQVLADRLCAGSVEFPYVDMDEVRVDGWALVMSGPGRSLTLGQLGRGRDALIGELRRARLPARRAAMLQSGSAAPVDAYEAWCDGVAVLVGLHADGLTVEPDAGVPRYVPLSCVTDVRRDGYSIAIRARATEPVVVSRLGSRTDEFLADLERARDDLAAATAEAYAALHPDLASLHAPDGWAVSAEEAGLAWENLCAVARSGSRAAEFEHLERLAGPSLRLGIKAGFAGGSMLFALAPRNGTVAVEDVGGSEDRATFVFASGDVERLNLALLLTSFRREAISADEDDLGRYAVAVRMLEVVRWARAALVARVVHDGGWADRVSAALS